MSVGLKTSVPPVVQDGDLDVSIAQLLDSGALDEVGGLCGAHDDMGDGGRAEDSRNAARLAREAFGARLHGGVQNGAWGDRAGQRGERTLLGVRVSGQLARKARRKHFEGVSVDYDAPDAVRRVDRLALVCQLNGQSHVPIVVRH